MLPHPASFKVTDITTVLDREAKREWLVLATPEGTLHVELSPADMLLLRDQLNADLDALKRPLFDRRRPPARLLPRAGAARPSRAAPHVMCGASSGGTPPPPWLA